MAPKRKTPVAKSGPKAKQAKTAAKRSASPEKTEEEMNLEVVREALLNEEYPVAGLPSNRKLLVDVLPFALADVIEERHAYQTDMVKCIDEALEAIAASLRAEVAKQEEVEASAESTAAGLMTAQEQAQVTLDEKIDDLEAKTGVARERKDELKQAEDDVSTAVKDQEEVEGTLEEQQERQEELRTAEVELYAPMREAKADKKSVKTLTKTLETMSLDSSLFKALPDALDKDVEERGMFDKMAMDYLDKQFTEQRAKIAEDITATTALLEEKKAFTASKEAVRDTAGEAKAAADSAKDEASDAKKEAAASLKEAEKAVKTHAKDVKEASSRKAEAEEDVAVFAKVLSSFHALRDRSSTPPVVEVPEPVAEEVVEAPVEEVPAVEAPVEVEQVLEVAEPVELVSEETAAKVAEAPVDLMQVEFGM